MELMTQAARGVTKATNSLFYWKLVYWKLAVKSLRVLGITFYTATKSVDWSGLSTFDKGLILGASVLAVLDVWDSFFDTTISELKSGQAPTGPTEPPLA